MAEERCPGCGRLLSDADHEVLRFLGLRVVACPEMKKDDLLILNTVPRGD